MLMRLLKQFFFGIIWLAVLVGIVVLIYKVLTPPPPPPTCGANCLPADLKPIAVYNGTSTIKIIPVATSTDHVSVLVQIINSNQDYAAKSFDYDLKLTDRNGSVSDITGSSFIYAGDLKYLAFVNIAAGEPAASFTADFQIQNTDWAKDTDFQKPSVTIQNKSTFVLPDHMEVQGKFLNGDPAPLTKATVVALLFDSGNNLIGVSQTETDNVASGEARAFTVTFPLISGVNISNTQVFVNPQN